MNIEQNNKLLATGSTEGKTERKKHVGGKKKRKKKDRAFARPCFELSSFSLSNTVYQLNT